MVLEISGEQKDYDKGINYLAKMADYTVMLTSILMDGMLTRRN